MKILAFDLATKCGVAVGYLGGKPSAWSVDLGRNIEEGQRFARALRMTERYIRDHAPDLVAIEAPVGGRDASAFLIGLIACVEAQSIRMGLRVVKYYPGSIRRHFLGKALTSRDFPSKSKSAAKAAIKGAVMAKCRLIGWPYTDADACDAMALFDYAASLESRSHQMVSVGGLLGVRG
jgi:Holliday junction resolvasome RuvABC endonuclease subunit